MKLYHFHPCPYCEKVRFALDHLGLSWDEIVVDPADRAAVIAASGQPLVPVLDDGTKVVADSTRILEYLAQEHDASLMPQEQRAQGLASLVEDWADEVLAPAVAGLSGPDAEAARTRLDERFESLDGLLHGRSYFAGDGLSHADIAVWSFVDAIPEELREEVLAPYASLREWYLNLADFRHKARRGGFGSMLMPEE